MRTLKFRAWDLDNGGMWYSDRDCSDGEWGKSWVIDRQGIHFEEMALDNLIEGGEAVQYERWHMPKQVVMQFTGLKDKNGREIYEGDIVGVPYVTPMGKLTEDEDDSKRTHVVFENGCFGLKYECYVKELVYWCKRTEGNYVPNYGCPTIFEDNTHLEVIGNIHEHPELVNPEKGVGK